MPYNTNIMINALFVIICAHPFISSLAYPYEHLYYCLITLVLMLVIIGRRARALTIDPGSIVSISIFAICAIFSLVPSISRQTSINEMYKYLFCLTAFLFATSLTAQETKRLFSFLTGTAAIIALAAIYQYFFGFRQILETLAKQHNTDAFTQDYLTRARAFFPFVTPNILALYLGMSLFIIPRSRIKIPLVLLIVVALLFTKSLGALFCLLLAFVIYRLMEKKLRVKHIVLCIAGLGIIAGLWFLRSYLQKTHLQPQFSAHMRLGYWKDAITLIALRPWTGFGIGNFNLMQSRYAHNSFLQIWAEMGIVGIISFLGFIFFVCRQGFRNVFVLPPEHKQAMRLLIAAFLLFAFHNTIDFGFYLPEVSFLWWLIAGTISRKTPLPR